MDAGSIHSSSYSGPHHHQMPTKVTTLSSGSPPVINSSAALTSTQQYHHVHQQQQQQQQLQQHHTTTTTYETSQMSSSSPAHVTSSPGYTLPENAYQSETRKISSVILQTQNIGDAPMDKETRYIEVPVIEEQVTYVTVKETREIEKKVPKYEYEWVERVVEVPKIDYVDKIVEVTQYEDVVVEKKIPHVVDKVVEHVREVKVTKPRIVPRQREVPGGIIEVPKPYPVEQKVEVIRHLDREVPVIVAQTVKPIIAESDKHVLVDVVDYEPEVIPVDVHIAKPVQSTLEAMGQVDIKHRLVNITAGQYNTILKLLNQSMDARAKGTLPFVSEGGRVPMIPERDAQFIMAPADIEIEGWSKMNTHHHHQQQHNMSEVIMTRGMHEQQQQEDQQLVSVYSVPQDVNKSRCCATQPRGASSIQNPSNVVVTHVLHDNGSRTSGRVASVQHSHRHHSKNGNPQTAYYEPMEQVASVTHHGSYTELSHPPIVSNHPTSSRKFVCC